MRRASFFAMTFGSAGLLAAIANYQARERSLKPFNDLIDLRWLLVYGILCVGSALALGLPGPHLSLLRAAVLSVLSCAFAATVFSLVSLIAGPWLLPRPVVLGAPIVLCPLYFVVSVATSAAWRRGRTRDRVLLVANEAEAARLRLELERKTQKTCSLVAVLSLPESSHLADGDLAATIDEHDVTVLVISENMQGNPGIVDQVSEAHKRGVRVRTLRLFYEQWLGKLPISELAIMHLMFDVGEIHGAVYRRVKRASEFLIGLVGLLFVGVLVPFILLANRIGNRGPLLFAQERTGLRGEPFTIYKFRSMRPTTTSIGEWTQTNDVRITRFGSLLRKSHIDELPQLWNLVRGDISLIGPRPEQTHYVWELRKKYPHYDFRHAIRPGLTGWAQVNYAYGNSDEDAREKLEYDIYYLRHQSAALDARIVLATFGHVLFGGGT